MNATTKLLAAGLAAGFLAVGFIAANGVAAAADMSVIDKRRDVMEKINGAGWNVIKKFVEDDKGSPADVKKAADAMAATPEKFLPLFVKGTGRPDVDSRKTQATAKIWEDWAGFEAAAKALRDEAAKMSKVAAGGDKAAITEQLKSLGRNGCGACHRAFKGKAVK